jgi:hypothetical protein
MSASGRARTEEGLRESNKNNLAYPGKILIGRE